MKIQLKPARERSSRSDGKRILVDRLWPRGTSKANLKLDAWIKAVAPSTELRQWFGHDPDKWPDFKRRYFRELDAAPDAVAQLREWIRGGPVTLLFGASDHEHNNAVALKDYLTSRRSSPPRKPGTAKTGRR